LLRDISLEQDSGQMDDLLGMHEPGYDQWAGLSCNRGDPEGEVAPKMEDSRETTDGPLREAQTSSHHSGTVSL
jgi:hypothetical protein